MVLAVCLVAVKTQTPTKLMMDPNYKACNQELKITRLDFTKAPCVMACMGKKEKLVSDFKLGKLYRLYGLGVKFSNKKFLKSKMQTYITVVISPQNCNHIWFNKTLNKVLHNKKHFFIPTTLSPILLLQTF